MNFNGLTGTFRQATPGTITFAKDMVMDGPSYFYAAATTAFIAAALPSSATPLLLGAVAVGTKLFTGACEVAENRGNAVRGWETGFVKYTKGY